MDRDRLKLCLLSPPQPRAREVFRRVLRLLDRNREAFGPIIIGRGFDSAREEAGWTLFDRPGECDTRAVHGLDSALRETDSAILHECEAHEIEAFGPDLLLCWEVATLGAVMSTTRGVPIVLGVTLDTILHGFLPIHPRILGYFHAAPFPRELVTGCGISLDRQFSLVAGVKSEAFTPASRSVAGRRKGILLIADDPTLITSVKSVCGLLGERLECLSYAVAGQGIAPDFFARYACVIAAGPSAINAAVAGVPVIVADERGTAGPLTRENLHRVLEADAGPGCFEAPVTIEELLGALRKCHRARSVELGREVCNTHGEHARDRQWVEWLRKLAHERKSSPFARNKERARLLWVGFGEATVATAFDRHGTAAQKVGLDEPVVEPVSEILLDCGAASQDILAPEARFRMPLNQDISAADTKRLKGFFGEGWCDAESWGRWTSGHEAILEFELEPDDRELELLLKINVYLPPGRLFQRVAVSVNGHIVMCWKLARDNKQNSYGVPLRGDYRAASGLCRIIFYLPDADSPFSWGRPDVRKLGFGLIELRLQPASPSIDFPAARNRVSLGPDIRAV